jgi:hypothetical protein
MREGRMEGKYNSDTCARTSRFNLVRRVAVLSVGERLSLAHTLVHESPARMHISTSRYSVALFDRECPCTAHLCIQRRPSTFQTKSMQSLIPKCYFRTRIQASSIRKTERTFCTAHELRSNIDRSLLQLSPGPAIAIEPSSFKS